MDTRTNPTTPPVMTPAQVAARLGVSLPTLRRSVREGIVPAPIRLSARRIGWPASQIEGFLSQK